MGTRRDNGSRVCGSVTLVTLPHVTDAATMRKISFWEVLGGESKNSLSRVGLRAASVQHVGLRNDQPLTVHPAFEFEYERGRDGYYQRRHRRAGGGAGPVVCVGELQQREDKASCQ